MQPPCSTKRFRYMQLGLQELKRDVEEGREDVRRALLLLVQGVSDALD